MENRKEPSISRKLWSKHHQVIPSQFPKSFRGAGNLVVFYDFFHDFQVFLDVQKFTKHHQVISTPETFRKLAWIHPTVFWFLELLEKSKVPSLYGPSPNYHQYCK